MVPLDDGVASYACNGVQTTFPITFPFKATTEITVRLRTLATGAETLWVQGTHYTVVGTDVVAVTAPTDTYSLWIIRATPIDQQDDLNDLSKFPAQGSEDISDKLTRIAQELGYKLGKALKLRQSSALSDIEVPDPEDGYFLRWAGNLLVNSKAFGGGSYTIGSFMSDFLQVATLAAMAAKIGIIDAGNRYTATEVETALQEIAGAGRTTETVKGLANLVTAIYPPGLIIVLSAGSPYTLIKNSYETILVTATTNPYIINLPQASTCIGYRVKIVAANPAITGLTKIVPYVGDAIGSLGANVPIYLQNVDQGGSIYLFQFITLAATVSGYWTVMGGQFCPEQAIDTNGSQYHFGKLHHLPLANTVNRQLYGSAPPALANWSAAITGAGVKGVPVGAKGIRLRVCISIYPTAAGVTVLRIAFSDNNSNTPAMDTAHPLVGQTIKAVAAGDFWNYFSEIDVPLNASGQFYIYTLAATNVTTANCQQWYDVVGYYMGD